MYKPLQFCKFQIDCVFHYYLVRSLLPFINSNFGALNIKHPEASGGLYPQDPLKNFHNFIFLWTVGKTVGNHAWTASCVNFA